MVLFCHELHCFVNTEHRKTLVILFFLCLFEKELGNIVVEFLDTFLRQEASTGLEKSCPHSIDQILVFLIEKLVKNTCESRHWVMNLTDHADQLADNYDTVQIVFNIREPLFKNTD